MQRLQAVGLGLDRLGNIRQGKLSKAGQTRAGQGRPGQARAGQGRPGQSRAGQGRPGHDTVLLKLLNDFRS
jgi:hypothetical protein